MATHSCEIPLATSVLGNFADGTGVDVSHGYMAEVITDPATRSKKIE